MRVPVVSQTRPIAWPPLPLSHSAHWDESRLQATLRSLWHRLGRCALCLVATLTFPPPFDNPPMPSELRSVPLS